MIYTARRSFSNSRKNAAYDRWGDIYVYDKNCCKTKLGF